MTARASGFYWVRAHWKIGIGNQEWQPAFWNGIYWYLIWSTDHFVDSDLLEIGERCEMTPAKKPEPERKVWWPVQNPYERYSYRWPDGSKVYQLCGSWLVVGWNGLSIGGLYKTSKDAAQALMRAKQGPYHPPEPGAEVAC